MKRADTPRRRPTTLAGLAVAMALVLVLAEWLAAGVAADLRLQHRDRHALLVANAIGASLAAAPPERLAERARGWAASGLSIESVRVSAGRELLASTRAEDAAPRALRSEERPLFDLANQLRAAAQTNAAEGVVRKKTTQIDDRTAAVVRVTVPYAPAEGPAGVVQVQLLPGDVAGVDAGPPWGLALLALAAAAGAGALLRFDPARRFDLPRAAAVLVLLVLAVGYQAIRAERLNDGQQARETAIAALQREVAAHGAVPGAGAPPAAASAWDTDAYGRPLNRLSADGTPLPGVATLNPAARFLAGGFAAIDALGLLVLLGFVQGRAARLGAALREHASAYAYVAPAMLGMLALVFFPFVYGIVLSFTDTTLFNESQPLRERWIGLDNFVAILGNFDLVESSPEGLIWNYQNFYWTLMVTIVWTIANVAIGVSVGFVLALALNTEGLRGKAIYRVILILPWAIPNYITALVWRGMFHPQFGVINQVLQAFGLEPVAWFDGVVSSFLTGLATNGWLSFPFMMVVILGALQSIPRDMYEAAEVEGATRRQQLLRITLPLLRPTLVPAVVLSVVWTFNMFNIIFLVSGGEPAGANEILITKAYKIAFENYQYAYAAAYSTVIFLILLAYGWFQTRLTRATESY